MATRRYFRRVPKNEQEWRDAATAAGVANSTLNSMQELRSGSKTTQTQFLLYRTICPAGQPPSMFDAANFGLAPNLIRARNLLAASAKFQNYIAVVGTNQPGNINRFEAVLDQQREVLHGLRYRRDPLKKNDEALVNASFVLFLQTILKADPAPRRKWRLPKIALTADFRTAWQKRQGVTGHKYTAITDGQMQDIMTDQIEAIVECKWTERRYHTPQSDMQEVSEIIALILKYPDPRNGQHHQRFTVSQDGDELYISFHKYDDNWVDYIERHTLNSRTGFLTIHRFGPWKIGRSQHVRQYAEIVLAASL